MTISTRPPSLGTRPTINTCVERNTKILMAVWLSLAALPLFAATWTDRGEYDLVLMIRSEVSAQKKIALLDEWKAKYPKTELRQARRELYLSTYQATGQVPRMFAIAAEMLAEQPGSFVGVYWSTVLIPEVPAATADQLRTGEKAARQLLAGLDQYFDSGRKPEPTSAAAWQKQKETAGFLAHRALGWIGWQRADYEAAEKEFTTCLQRDSANGEISVWFGMVLALEKRPETTPASLWHLVHAAAVTGDGALPENQRAEVNTLAERLYAAYHGETDGLAAFRTSAATAPFPPAGFNIESAAVVAVRRQEEELIRTNPELAAWLKIRKRLDAADGEQYFTESLRTSPLPKLKGTVIRSTPESRPKEIVLGLSAPASEEVVLKLDAPGARVKAGTELRFEGSADSFVRSPFSLTVTVNRDQIEVVQPSTPPAQ